MIKKVIKKKLEKWNKFLEIEQKKCEASGQKLNPKYKDLDIEFYSREKFPKKERHLY